MLRLLSVIASAYFALVGAALAGNMAENCLIKVDGMFYLEGRCPYSVDGNSITVGLNGDQRSEHWARLTIEPDGKNDTAHAFWNGSQASADALTDIGIVERYNACWLNKQVRICFSPARNISDADDDLAAEIEADQEESRRDQERRGVGEFNLGEAVQGLAATASLTCLFSDEDTFAPEARTLMRGYAGGRSRADIPQLRDIIFDGDAAVTIGGNAHKLLAQDGDILMVSANPSVAVPTGPTAGLTQDQLSQLQSMLGTMSQIGSEATGLDRRVFLINFATRGASLATFANNRLSQHQPLRCQ